MTTKVPLRKEGLPSCQFCFEEQDSAGLGALEKNLEFFYFGQQHTSTLR